MDLEVSETLDGAISNRVDPILRNGLRELLLELLPNRAQGS
jgi:hypothetical protein